MVEEMILLLSSLFLFFYNEYPCSVDKLLYLVQVFKVYHYYQLTLSSLS